MGGSHIAACDSGHDVLSKHLSDIVWQTLCRLLRDTFEPLLHEQFKRRLICWGAPLPHAAHFEFSDPFNIRR